MHRKIVAIAERAAKDAFVASNVLAGIIKKGDIDRIQEQIVSLHASLETLVEYRRYLTCEYCRNDLDCGDSSCIGCRARLSGELID